MELVDDSQGTAIPPTFGATLRQARLSRNISLDAVAAHTKINRSFFRDLERNDLSKWPTSQFYRETYLRAYSTAIGLNPQEVIDGFRRELDGGGSIPVPKQALPPAKPRRLTPVTIPIILAVTFIASYSLARWLPPSSRVQTAKVVNDTADTADTAASSRVTPAGAPNSESTGSSKVEAPPAEATLPDAITPVVEHVAGELVINSTPPGALVLVNGIRRGATPMVVQSLPAGSYAVRFILPGHTGVTRHATISPGRRRVEVSADFEPKPAEAVE